MSKLLPLYKAILEQVKQKKIDLNTGTSLIKLLQDIPLQGEEPADIAVIGLAGTFPHAADIDQWWDRIIGNKVNAIRELPQHRAEDIDWLLGETGGPPVFGKGAYLEDIDRFDPGFFHISLREARLMDPHQKLFLQTLWHCIEDAGYGGGQWQGSRTGIYVGYSTDFGPEYKRAIEQAAPGLEELSLAGNIKSMLAGRAAHLFDFAGPAMLVDTACSSSLVAVHTACKAIQHGECDQALAGGIKLCLAPFETDYASGFSIVAKDYTAKTFDAAANGTGLGEGTAAIALKRLDRAVQDGDQIYAVIKGSAVTQDGSSIGLTAPNPAAQEEALVRAWEDAGIDPETIGYIEAHGTGTALGDPIEIEGITGAFRRYTSKRQFCAVGSLKTNIGHLDAAAGIAGLIKTIMALRHRKLPPTLHMNRPNPAIRFEESPVYVNDRLQDWHQPEGVPRRAGVSSFGLSGTNCHLIVEEYRPPAQPGKADEAVYTRTEAEELCLFTLSAYSAPALRTLAATYIQWLEQEKDMPLLHLCYSVNTGMLHKEFRIAIEATRADEVRQELIRWHEAAANVQDGRGTAASSRSSEAQQKLLEWKAATDREKKNALLGQLAELYRQGAALDWRSIYEGQQLARVRLPLYPFRSDRTWLEHENGKSGTSRKRDAHSQNQQQIAYYTSGWQSTGRAATDESGARDALIIAFGGSSELASDLDATLRQQDKLSLIIETADISKGSVADQAPVSPVEEVLNSASFAYRDIFLIHETSGEGEDRSFSDSLVHMYQWVQSLLGKISSRSDDIRVCFVTRDGAHDDHPLALHPLHAAISGLAKVFGQENPRIRTCCLDADRKVRASHILAELSGASRACPVLLREGDRYVEQLDCCQPATEDAGRAVVRKHGVYLITGGLGGIGLTMAAALARAQPVNLVLAGRQGLPPREQWDRIVAEGVDTTLIRSIGTIREMIRSGSEVDVLAVNVADEAAVSRMFTHIRQRWGPVNGILHCAGVAGEQRIITKTIQAFQEVVAPKLDGTLLLDALTSEDKPDFIVLFSSITSLLAGEGQADYAAANSFMNAYCTWEDSKRSARRLAAIVWPAWRETGMAAEFGIEDDDVLKAITSDEAVQAFWRMLAMTQPVIAVGAWNSELTLDEEEGLFRLSDRLLESLPVGSLRHDKVRKPDRESLPETARTAVDWKLPGAVLDQVQTVLGELLDMREPDIHASLHDMGVDSIMGGILVQRINSIFPDTASPVDLYTFPTAASISEHILDVLQSREAVTRVDEQKPVDEHERMLSLLRGVKEGSVTVDATLDWFQKGMGK